MDSLLQSRHKSRIAETPFRWLLEIVDPIELNMKLFKQLVRRWVPHHQSFRVRQQLVPLNVVDVVMSLGLGVGGMEVQFDESIVGKVGELFNSTQMKLKEMVNMFNNIVVNEEVDVDVLWVYECLCLHDNSSCKVFPWLRGFRSLDYDTEEINLLLKKGEVQFDWYLSSTDQQNPIIRATFIMDAVGRSEVKPEIGFYSCEYSVGARVEKIRKNNMKIRCLKDEIAAIRKELTDRRKTPKVEQYHFVNEAGVDVDGEGNEGAGGDAEEEPVVDAHEEVAHDEAAVDAPEQVLCEQGEHEEPAPEEGAHVEATIDATKEAVAEEDRHAEEAVLQEGAHEEGAPKEAAHHEVAVDARKEVVHDEGALVEAAHHEVADEVAVDEASAGAEAEDEESVHQPPPIINLADVEDDEVISHVQLLVGEPLKTFHGDPRESVVMFCSNHVHVHREKVDWIHKEGDIQSNSHLLSNNKKRIANRQVWQLSDYHPYFPTDLLSVQDLVSADLVLIPFVKNGHWWCYALKVSSQQIFVIDSLEKGIRGRAGFDRSIICFIVDAKNIQWLWGLLMNTTEDSKFGVNIEKAKIPVQPNTYDCGVIMMKVFELWDGDDKYDGKNMSNYTNEELVEFRKKYICDWILDEDNLTSTCVIAYRQAVIAYQCVCTEIPTLLPCSGIGPTSGEGICVLSASVSDYRLPVTAYQRVCTESPTLLPCSGRVAPKCVVRSDLVRIIRLVVIAYQCLCTESPTLLPGSGTGAPKCVNLNVELRMDGCVLAPTIGEGICVLSACVSDYRQACLCTESPTLLPGSGRGAPQSVVLDDLMNGCLLGPTCGEGICVLSACVSAYRQAVIAYQCLCTESPTLLPYSARGAPNCVNLSVELRMNGCVLGPTCGEGICVLSACISAYRQAVIAYQCLSTESPTLLPCSGRGAPKCVVLGDLVRILNAELRMNECLLGPTSGEGICVLSACVSDYRQAVIVYQCLCSKSPTLLSCSARRAPQFRLYHLVSACVSDYSLPVIAY
ncbi:hypothetical protein V8G54_004885 [Vigna mungo]|uniref:Ubiquitin-like protease family profile domain-containing protein n=1 Tax=Vigna mungo TaxID=3915 RepID=A0AAQ3SFW0_VIGMU